MNLSAKAQIFRDATEVERQGDGSQVLRDERDGRRTLFWLTAASSDALARRIRVLDPTRLEQAAKRLSPAQRAALIEGMTALIASAEQVSQRVTWRKP